MNKLGNRSNSSVRSREAVLLARNGIGCWQCTTDHETPNFLWTSLTLDQRSGNRVVTEACDMDRRFQDQRIGALIAGTLECMVSIREVQSGRQKLILTRNWKERLSNSCWPWKRSNQRVGNRLSSLLYKPRAPQDILLSGSFQENLFYVGVRCTPPRLLP